jgi:hypothetical protein
VFQGNIMISKDIRVPADNISSWSTSSRRTVFNCRTNVEQRKVSEVPSRDTKANSFQNRRTEFRNKVNLNKEKSIEVISSSNNNSNGSRRGSTWPRGYTPCWHVYTNKTRVMSFIATKSVACMSTSWLLDNVYTAKACKDKKRDPDALEFGLVS